MARIVRGGALALACALLSLPLLGAAHGVSAAAASSLSVTPDPVLAWGSNF